MKYFAYGSNMSIRRLSARVPTVERLGTYRLVQHQLRFHKKSADGSGKCDAFFTGNSNDTIIGALYEINYEEKHMLDTIEGLGKGYDEKIVIVANENGEQYEAITYYATDIDTRLLPYTWYLNHVIIGAKEINAPIHYLNGITSTNSSIDQNKERSLREFNIHR
ncbi:gamma-glutamylcyclotransferase family protein [Thalassotalea crassostreae]|uniref:gamma-glutamylcyclotransferase family protein n=1 Tax=Thalassotalea crassostreae TaxID=1763536 RepID=UPI000838C112|nr:gamma-glutamylcyclotransferase family protein [Thalassotalea crassostreae]